MSDSLDSLINVATQVREDRERRQQQQQQAAQESKQRQRHQPSLYKPPVETPEASSQQQCADPLMVAVADRVHYRSSLSQIPSGRIQ